MAKAVMPGKMLVSSVVVMMSVAKGAASRSAS
jgi:hypothetical protein